MRMREEEEEKAHAAEIEAIKQERDLCTKRELDIERERVEKDQLWRDVTAIRRRQRLQGRRRCHRACAHVCQVGTLVCVYCTIGTIIGRCAFVGAWVLL